MTYNRGQVRQALEKLSFVEAVELAKALAPRLYTSWDTIVRAMIDVADEVASGEDRSVVEKNVVEEVFTEQ